VILGELKRLPGPHAIDAAVSDLSQHHRLAEAHHGADGGAHARLAPIELGHREQQIGGCLDRALEQARGSPRFFLGRLAAKVE
jgi:hypothetical protein